MTDAPLPHVITDPAGSIATTVALDTSICVHAVLAIDNFAILRRQLGRSIGPTAAEAVAGRVASLSTGLTVSVVGRDRIELAGRCANQAALLQAIVDLEAACGRSFALGGGVHEFDVLIGASSVGQADHDDLRLVEDAEQALDEARVERRAIVRSLRSCDMLDRIALKRDLGTAIADEALFIHYQPKINLRRGEVAGLEALIRWRHPSRGLVSPADFIPIAEESRDIVRLTLWTLCKVIEDQRALARAGHDLVIYINVAGVLLADTRFVQAVRDIVPPGLSRIGFEITETSVIRDPDSAIANLKLFADMGIAVAIDDYGAGLSSLSYLKQLPARELKIDKLFITQLTSSHRDPLIVRSTIDLAHALDMAVVAEGVESEATQALLAVMGCDMAQGFHISRPIGFEALVQFLDQHAPSAHATQARFAGLSVGGFRR